MAGVLSLLAVGLLFVATTGARAEPGARLRVRIENVSPGGGMMRLGLFTEASYSGNDARPVAALDLPAADAIMQEVEFADVPPGVYAIQVFQDLNGNGKMDFNWAGLPVEPYGFSRDALPTVAKPVFARVKITLDAGANAPIVIHLRNSGATDRLGAATLH
jgi:uncharacterized protein (DUF2141 family)